MFLTIVNIVSIAIPHSVLASKVVPCMPIAYDTEKRYATGNMMCDYLQQDCLRLDT